MADDIEALFGPKAGKHGEDRLKAAGDGESVGAAREEPAHGIQGQHEETVADAGMKDAGDKTAEEGPKDSGNE